MTSNFLEITNLIKGFRLSCQTEGKSPKTIEWYLTFLFRFTQFLESARLPTEINSITKNHVKQFILYLQTEVKTPYGGKPLSGATIQGYVRALKTFFSWAEREGYIKPSQFGKIPLPKANSKIINTFSQEDIEKLVATCQASNSEGQRNLTVILLLLDSGIRVSELVNIELDDVSLAEGIIRIRFAKGGNTYR